MLRPRSNTFFRPNPSVELTIGELSGELNAYAADIDIADDQLSGGQNITRARASDSSLKKRGGISAYGPFLGTGSAPYGAANIVDVTDAQYTYVGTNTGIYAIDGTTNTLLTGVTITTHLPSRFVYYPATNKTYYVNGTDNVVKITPGATSGDQTDAAFKKGLYIELWKNRLLVAQLGGTSGKTIWYTDVGVDTFSSNNNFSVPDYITGLKVLGTKLIIATKFRLYRVENFLFNGVTTDPVGDEIPTSFGAIAQETMVVVNGLLYFLGQDTTNKAAIYVCDGYQCKPISDDKISSILNSLSPTYFIYACAVRDGFSYRLHVTETGKTANNLGILYDTVRGYFYPPERRFIDSWSDFAVMWSSETSGEWDVYGIAQATPQVYKLNANDGLYDELPEENYLTSGSYNVPIDANPAKRCAQSFKLTNYLSNQSVNITQIALQLKKNAGTTTGLTIRIETDSGNAPSGTLAATNATATISAFSTTSYAWKHATFTTPVTLSGRTKYWLVAQHTTEGSGNSQYQALADSCTATYASGTLATYSSSAWHPDATSDLDFIVYCESPIDAYFDTKAFLPANGKEFNLERFQTIFNTVGSYNAEVSFAYATFSGATAYLVSLVGVSGASWDDGVTKWDGGTAYWDGGQTRSYGWTEIDSFVGRVVKMRVRNRNANQQIEFNRAILELSPRLSQS